MTVAQVPIEQMRAEASAMKPERRAGRFSFEPKRQHSAVRPRFQIQPLESFLRATPMRWLVNQVIPTDGLVVVLGASGSGKTFLVLDMVCAVARGESWANRRTIKANIVYIAAEGSLGPRIRSYLAHHQLEAADLAALRVLQTSVNLRDPHVDLDDLILDLQSLRNEIGPIGAIVIDTLNRVMAGGNENSPEDMGAVINHVTQLQQSLQCAAILVHHTGKDESRGGRGHSSLIGAIDGQLTVFRDDAIRTVKVTKMRDGEDGNILLSYRLVNVDIGPLTDVDPQAHPDERQTSCVVVPCDTRPALATRDEQSRHRRLFLKHARHGEALDAVRTHFYDDLQAHTQGAKQKAFARAAKWSSDAGTHAVVDGRIHRFDRYGDAE